MKQAITRIVSFPADEGGPPGVGDVTDNDYRAGRVASLLDAYRAVYDDKLSTSEALVDIITDLLHHADRNGIHPDDLLDAARMHHRAEVDGDIG